MITHKEKAEEIYNTFNSIIYTSLNHKQQVFNGGYYLISEMINENYFDEECLVFWESVKEEYLKLK